MAELAVAAWNCEELGEVDEESCDEFELRLDAAELVLIGLAFNTRGVRDGEEVVVGLDVAHAAAALRALRATR